MLGFGFSEYFLIGPEGLLGDLTLVVGLMLVVIKRDPGWRSHALFAVAPAVTQVVMLAIVGSLGQHPAYTVMAIADLVSLYMIYQSFKRSSRTITRGIIAFSQFYAIALACFLGLMIVNHDSL